MEVFYICICCIDTCILVCYHSTSWNFEISFDVFHCKNLLLTTFGRYEVATVVKHKANQKGLFMNLKLKRELLFNDLSNFLSPFHDTVVVPSGDRIIHWSSYSKDEFYFERIKFIQLDEKTSQSYSIDGLEVLPDERYFTRDLWVSEFLGCRGHQTLDSRAALAIWEYRQVLIPIIIQKLRSRPPLMSMHDEVLIAFAGDLWPTNSSPTFLGMTGILIKGNESRAGWVSTYLDEWFSYCKTSSYAKVYFATV